MTWGLQIEPDPALGWESGELGQPLSLSVHIPVMHNHSISLLGPSTVYSEVAVRGAIALRAVYEVKALPKGPLPQQDGQPAFTLQWGAGISSTGCFHREIVTIIVWLRSPELMKRNKETGAEDEAEEEEEEDFLAGDLLPFRELHEWICKHHRQDNE